MVRMHTAHANTVLIVTKLCASSENCLSEACNQRAMAILSYRWLFQVVKSLVNPCLIFYVYYDYASSQDGDNGLSMHKCHVTFLALYKVYLHSAQ